MGVYYNEIDPFAAAWLRALMKANQIPDGEVDERSIAEVTADDVRGFRQCHFFAGIGGWAYALRLAGWPDDRAVWTGSCPCQPWSVAGFSTGTTDPRHLWPAWERLIAQCRPPVVFGEQVASEDGKYWCDLVCADLEALGYAFGAGVLPAACVGAPEGRHRLWFVAHAAGAGSGAAESTLQDDTRGRKKSRREDARVVEQLADTDGNGRERRGGGATSSDETTPTTRQTTNRGCDASRGLADANGAESGYEQLQRGWRLVQLAEDPLTGIWSGADWLRCDDGKIRPVESGTFPLAHGLSERVGRLRGYGNAIIPQVAQVFIEAYLDGEF